MCNFEDLAKAGMWGFGIGFVFTTVLICVIFKSRD